MTALIPLFEDPQEAREALAKSRVAANAPLPDAVRMSIRATFGEDLSPEQVVRRVIDDVRERGDAALRHYAHCFDGVEPDDLLVPAEEVSRAPERVTPEVRAALESSADRIRAFHERSRRQTWIDFSSGHGLGQVMVPIHRVGVYAPGGRAAYPSTVLMAAVPARVAGVEEVVLASPPQRDGAQNQAVLAAAAIAGVDRVYRVGGAQAIAALAYGTETVEKVDKIVGPGNIFVVLAKQAVAGQVGIDGIPGPTETIVIADDAANPSWAAADMIAQAEHDPLAQSVLVCLSRRFADSVLVELDRQLADAPRAEVVRESFQRRGAMVIVGSVSEAMAFANDHAPEHMCLAMANPWDHLASVRNAGGIFVGEGSVEALGDYTAGPSHIMPTSGTARFASALCLDDFIKVVPLFSYDVKQEEAAARTAMVLAHAEGLTGHAAAIAARLEPERSDQRSRLETQQPSPRRGTAVKGKDVTR